MADVHVAIAGRSYRMACDDGQEDHLRALASRLDLKIAEMRVRFGEIGDQRVTVMAALTLADEAADAERRVASLEAEVKSLRASQAAVDTQVEAVAEAAAAALIGMAQRIEQVAERVGSRAKQNG